jgi:hypothetical protein
MNDQAVIVPRFPEKLPGSLWGIAAFFNPAQYKNKLQNYKIFRQSSQRQGLKLLVVELAFGDKPFELAAGDSDALIQLRTSAHNVLWQKERLLNIGLHNLPDDCDKIVWIDCDIIFQNDHWINDTCGLLESYVIVQPFSEALLMQPGSIQTAIEETNGNGFAEGKKSISRAFYMAEPNKRNGMCLEHSHPGFAWAARRDVFRENLLFDKTIIFGADCTMADAFYGRNCKYISKRLVKDYRNWSKQIYPRIQGSVFYSPGTVAHLWHGAHQDKLYGATAEILDMYRFDPQKDIKIDAQGIWVWNSNKPLLHKALAEYFWFRNEEGADTADLKPRTEIGRVKARLDACENRRYAKDPLTIRVFRSIRRKCAALMNFARAST